MYMCSHLNFTLIKLSKNLDSPYELKKKVAEILYNIVLAFSSSTIKKTKSRFENAVLYNLRYTATKFSDVLEEVRLTSDFEK